MTSASKKIGVVRFPGTNCDQDVFDFVKAKNFEAQYLWHLDQFETSNYQALIIPGGFSYGDYLRSGALAARSPVMKSVGEFINKGGPVLGICNGFQILCEAGHLPGALVKNQGMEFIDDWVDLKLVKASQAWGSSLKSSLRLPVAHGDGRYFNTDDGIKKLQDQNQIWFQYEKYNPNGSLQNIAGVMSEKGNVAALMPHPERALYDWMGGSDGWNFL